MLVTEQIFELNLPTFEEIILPTFKGFNDDHLKSNYLTLENLSEIIKPEYLTIAGLDWKRMNYFKKSNYTGSIHSDANTSAETIFCINWVSDGDGLMDFWDESIVVRYGVTTGSFNKPNFGLAPRYYATVSPCKSYTMKKNHAYLVNASTPHRAVGFENRRCYSMRTYHTDIAWDDVIKIFDQYIIK